jgi:hypothetical protein
MKPLGIAIIFKIFVSNIIINAECSDKVLKVGWFGLIIVNTKRE